MNTKKLKAGSNIYHPKYKEGITLGNKTVRNGKDFYHTYFFKSRKFGYYSSLKLIAPPTTESVKKAQQIILKSISSNKYKKGDIIEHPIYGTGIILGDNHKRGKNIYYHIYYKNDNTFGYNSEFTLISKRTEETERQANDILYKNCLLPAFKPFDIKTLDNISDGIIIQQVDYKNYSKNNIIFEKIATKYPLVKKRYFYYCSKSTGFKMFGKCLPVTLTSKLKVVSIFTQFTTNDTHETYSDVNALIKGILRTIDKYPNDKIYIPKNICSNCVNNNWDKIHQALPKNNNIIILDL